MNARASTDGVAVEAGDGVLHLVLDRPQRKNALDTHAVRRLVETLEEAATDDRLRVITLSGSGGDFCSGADWVSTNAAAGERPRTGSVQRRTALQAHRLIQLLMEIQVPVVCTVRGWAAGLGCQLALASDFTVAADTSRFWEPFTTRGFTPDSGATWLLPRLVGVARARELLMLGTEITGTRAEELGLIFRSVPEDRVDAETAALVERLAGAATVALGLTKRCITRSLQMNLSDSMEAEAFALELSSRTGDFKEGLAAFGERRPAKFTGR